MNYITEDGDTLLGIASRFTLSPEYASAIARQNGMQESTPVDVALEPGLELTIPDNWLKFPTIGGTSNDLQKVLFYGSMALIVLALFLKA